MYYYSLYGCSIESYLEFPQLCVNESTNQSDIEIVEGGVPAEVIEKAAYGYYEVGKKLSWFQNDTGLFSIEDGRRIRYQLVEGANVQYARSYILGYAVSMLLLQRGIITIHCSTIANEEGAILIAGESGSGKSTLTTSFLKDGFQLMADDIVAVRNDQKQGAMAEPAFPYQKLCRDMVNRENMKAEDLIYIDEQKDKFLVSRKDQFRNEPVPVKLMVMLTKSEGDELEVQEIEGVNKLFAVRDNMFLKRLHSDFITNPYAVQACLGLCSNCPIYLVKRPKDKDTMVELKERIDELVHKKENVTI